jgi:hypothetical protein
MGLIIVLLITLMLFLVISYYIQYSVDLNSKPEQLLKDGLVKELITKAVDSAIPLEINEDEIKLGRFTIKKSHSGAFWFPYFVYREALPYGQRNSEFDWGENIGYVRWLSKDWKLIKELTKKSTKSVEQKQRQKLNLNK